MHDMKQHPLSAAFPGMTEKELEELIRDIKEHGQRDPIMLYQGMVLDGWHRYRACVELDRVPDWEELGEDVDPVAYAQSKNLHRRHLTGSQRAAAVVACAKWAPVGHNQHRGGGEATSHPQTNEVMAKAADVSEKTIKQAKRAHEAGLGEAVRDGKVTAERAAELAKLPEDARQAALDAPKEARTPKTPAPETCPESDELVTIEGYIPDEITDDLKPQRPAEVEGLKTQIEVLRKSKEDLSRMVEALNRDITVARVTLDAEDLLGRFNEEVCRVNGMNVFHERRVDALLKELEASKRKAQQMKAAPKTSPGVEALRARIAELEEEIADLAEQLDEMASIAKELQEENQSLERVAGAEDQHAAMLLENKRFRELARVTQERAVGIQNQNHAMSKTAKHWMDKFQRLEKKVKGTVEPDPDPVEANPEQAPAAPYDPMFDGPEPTE